MTDLKLKRELRNPEVKHEIDGKTADTLCGKVTLLRVDDRITSMAA